MLKYTITSDFVFEIKFNPLGTIDRISHIEANILHIYYYVP